MRTKNLNLKKKIAFIASVAAMKTAMMAVILFMVQSYLAIQMPAPVASRPSRTLMEA